MEKQNCGNCHQRIVNKEHLTCCTCKKSFHLNCTSVSACRFYNTMKKIHKTNWKCDACVKKSPKISVDALNLSSSPDDETVREHVTMRKNHQINVPTENSFSSLEEEEDDIDTRKITDADIELYTQDEREPIAEVPENPPRNLTKAKSEELINTFSDNDHSLLLHTTVSRSVESILDIGLVRELKEKNEELIADLNSTQQLLEETIIENNSFKRQNKKLLELVNIAKQVRSSPTLPIRICATSCRKKRNQRPSMCPINYDDFKSSLDDKTRILEEKIVELKLDAEKYKQEVFELSRKVEELQLSLQENASKKPNKSKDKPRIFIVSDEQGKGVRKLLQKELGQRYQIFADLKPGAHIDSLLECTQSEMYSDLGEFDYVIILCGKNDMNPMKMTAMLYYYLNSLHKKTNVIICETSANTYLNVNHINNVIRFVSAQFSGVNFVDLRYSYLGQPRNRAKHIAQNVLREIYRLEYSSKLEYNVKSVDLYVPEKYENIIPYESIKNSLIYNKDIMKIDRGTETDYLIDKQVQNVTYVDKCTQTDIVTNIDSGAIVTSERAGEKVSLDSPTVSVTQFIPPWPKPWPKHGPPEPDPSPVPSPPPTPPPKLPPEGEAEEEAEEEEDEDLDEEQLAAKKAEELRRKLELEELKRLAECPPMPPPFAPPCTPEPEEEPRLREPPSRTASDIEARRLLATAPARPTAEDLEVEELEEVDASKKMLPLQDDVSRYRRKKATRKAAEDAAKRAAILEKFVSPPDPAKFPSNFLILPDDSAILRGSQAVSNKNAAKQLPFTSIMAIMTSFKYKIDTWTKSIVDFVINSGTKLCSQLEKQHHMGPSYILPKITIGHESYKPSVNAMFDGATWRLEEILEKYLPQYDRGIITTCSYSCAFFERTGYFYLFDGSNCNCLGVRTQKGNGKACFLRFPNLHRLVNRIQSNKDGRNDEQQFVLTRVTVEVIPTGVRYKLDDKYNFVEAAENLKYKMKVYDGKKKEFGDEEMKVGKGKCGYQNYGGECRIVGSTALSRGQAGSHFVCLVAMLAATIRPLRLWDSTLVDLCIEKGIEIYKKTKDASVCEKRVIKNFFIGGKYFDLNISHIKVINENTCKTTEQYVRSVLFRLRYVIIQFQNGVNLVLSQTQGFFNVFDCYAPPLEVPDSLPTHAKSEMEERLKKYTPKCASWTKYSDIESVLSRLEKHADRYAIPNFFTFEVTSIRNAPHHAMLAYKLTQLFKTAENPNLPYIQQKTAKKVVNEKLSWVTDDDDTVPWSTEYPVNPIGLHRKTPRSMWQDWNIEFPGELCSLWGTLHPTDSRFPEEHRGKQYLACCMVALVLTQTCNLVTWTSGTLDGIVIAGDKYHEALLKQIGNRKDYEISCTSFDGLTGQYACCTFTPKSKKTIFGFVYNIVPDRFNLSHALQFFFETERYGILESHMKNLAFGKVGGSYFMFDCQTKGSPVFNSPTFVAAYALKCETLSMLVYCMTLTLNVTQHNELFHLFSVDIKLKEHSK